MMIIHEFNHNQQEIKVMLRVDANQSRIDSLFLQMQLIEHVFHLLMSYKLISGVIKGIHVSGLQIPYNNTIHYVCMLVEKFNNPNC